MLTQLAGKVEDSLEHIDTNHPGLDKHQSDKLAIFRSLLEDIQHQANDMAKELIKKI